MEYTFVLKDKGTPNQGWWLKISSVEELVDYIKQTNPVVFGKVFENYVYGKEFNSGASGHSPHMDEVPLTRAVVMNAEKGQTIFQAMDSFSAMVAMRRLEDIKEYGCIFINSVGGSHADYDGPHEYDFIRRKTLVFPDFKKEEIRIRQFEGGQHFYAYIGDVQVRDGDILKWNTYEEAYEKAMDYLKAC